jgi:hypothetical protein
VVSKTTPDIGFVQEYVYALALANGRTKPALVTPREVLATTNEEDELPIETLEAL